MKISIFIKSWQRDFEWLAYCLRSIQRFVTGHSEIVVALPSGHGLPLTAERIVIADEWRDPIKPGAPSPGYYHQMYVKLCADLYCPDADHIMIVDSDCLFNRPFDVSQLFQGGKPMLLRRTWAESGDGVVWKEPAEHALGFEATHDTMACHPAIYRREDFTELRSYLEHRHGKNLADYIRSRPRFIEFVTMGNFILRYYPEAHAVIDYGPGDVYPRPLIQGWSWGGLTPASRARIESILS